MKKLYCILALMFLPLMTLAAEPLGSACYRANGTYSQFDGNDYFSCPKEVSEKNITIQELYAKGYRVVSADIIRRSDGAYSVNIIIEKRNIK